ncbi:MAG: hypothetical protein WAR37_02815 [Candidatus Microsaccharimonas sp.]
MKQPLLRIAVFLLLSAAVTVSSFQPAAAYQAHQPYYEPWYGRQFTCDPMAADDGYGAASASYFDGACTYGLRPGQPDTVRRVIPEGIPGWVNNTDTYFSWLQDTYNRGGRWQTAAAYIVNSMLGNNGGGGGRSVSSGQWNSLRDRLASHTMHDEWRSTNGVNTQMGGIGTNTPNDSDTNRFDVIAYRDDKWASAWVFKDADGNDRYVVYRDCANPVGRMPGLSDQPAANYNLTPTISLDQTMGEIGTPVNLSPVVNNGGTTASTGNQWQVVRFTIPANQTPPGAATNGSDPIGYYGNGATTVSNGNQVFQRNATSLSVPPQVLDNVNSDSKVCFALSVQPVTQTDASWSHSAPACIAIAKRPKVQVLGGDLIVGRATSTNLARLSNVTTAVTNSPTSGIFGSWAEYAIIPSGLVMGMASGSGYVGGAPTGDLCSLSVLTFANRVGGSCQPSAIGQYSHTTAAPDVALRFPTDGAQNIPGGSVNLATMNNVYTKSSGSLTISASADISAGRSVVINAPNVDVTITSDIRYTTASLTKIQDIPQVVIIARNIIIADSVTQIDSWLIASGSGTEGRLNTCGAGAVGEATQVNTTICTQKLVINGPIQANHLLMRRTAGAEAGLAAGDPAEVFNLRADAYIWGGAYSPGTGRIPTVVTKELPPRF